MIKRLFEAFRSKTPEPPSKVEELDLENVYVRLKMAIERIGSSPIRLAASPVSLGKIESFSDSMEDLLKSLIEVNHVLKENTHVESGLFYVKRIKSVSFDQFLFVRDGFYVNNADETLQKVFEQIEVYYEKMKFADTATYGIVEHNHRQLFAYTNTLVHFLNSIFDHFGV